MPNLSASPFLRTRVARRVLLLFLLCAVLPLLVLALLGYSETASDLMEATRTRLRSESKSSGMMLAGRLGQLTSLLETLGAASQLDRPLPTKLASTAAAASGPRFRAVAITDSSGTERALLGEVGDLPPLDSIRLRHLREGGVALMTAPGTTGLRVFLVRNLAPFSGARVWGLIDATSVWGLDPGISIVQPGMRLCLVDVEHGPLSCGSAEEQAAQSQNPGIASFEWQQGDERFLAGQWTLFFKRVYAAPSWVLTLSVPEVSVFEPIQALRRTFVLGLILALAVVFVASHVQLRRSMGPLEALSSGTRRVAAGNFDEPVLVDTHDEFRVLADSFNTMARDLGREFRRRTALEALHRAALAADGPGPVLGALFGNRSQLLDSEDLVVAMARPDDPFWWTISSESSHGKGRPPRDARPSKAEVAELLANPGGLVVRRGERGRSYFQGPKEVLSREVLILPLLRKGALVGALMAQCKMDQEGHPEALIEGRRSADQLAVALSNIQLVEQLDAMHWGALTALARTIDAVSPWTAGHSERVTLGAIEIARRLGLDEADIKLIHRGGLLHDIGKVAVPAAILDKPGPLTAEEFDIIRTHPAVGARILAPIGPFRQALPLVLHHHELLDGSGYPHGLKGDQIPRIVRILTVADVFDALVSDRPYRTAWTIARAIDHLRGSSGTKFDVVAVTALAEAIAAGWQTPKLPTGSLTDVAVLKRFSMWPSAFSESPAGSDPPFTLAVGRTSS